MDSITDICYDWLPNKAVRITELYIKPLERQIEKLESENQQYKDKLADGRIIELPCRVGDVVYILIQTFVKNKLVWSIYTRVIDELNSNKLNSNTMISKKPFELHFYPSEIDKTVFLTREEAEKVLREMENNNEIN